MVQSKPFRRTAIVVEDDAIQRDMIALLLEESDFTVIKCEDAETAFLALNARHPSLLITDINLTGKMNGVELAHVARMNDPMLRVVVISGQHSAAALPDGVTFPLEAGLSCCLDTGSRALMRSVPVSVRQHAALYPLCLGRWR